MIQMKESTSENVGKEKEVMTKSLTEVDSAHIARDSRERTKFKKMRRLVKFWTFVTMLKLNGYV